MHVLLSKTILVTNTPEPLSVTPLKCAYATVQEAYTNNNAVFLGDANVDAYEGIQLFWLVSTILQGRGGNDIDLSQLYVYGDKDDVVNVLYYIL
jgi:hypothetical protein